MRAVSLFHPFHSFDNSFARFVNPASFGSGFHGAGLRVARSTHEPVGFAMDAVEYDDRYVITANLPGVPKDQISIEVDNDRITVATHAAAPTQVAASTSIEPEQSDSGSSSVQESNAARVLRKERYVGSYERTFVVSMPIAADRVSAKLELGVLELTLPKVAQKSAKKIVVM
jgi:HSP20 family protein